MLRKLIIALLLLLLPASLLASQDEAGNWLMYFGSNKISEQFSIHSEVQYRNHTLVPNNIEQLLLRTGVNFHFSEKAFATVGYAYIPSYEYKSSKPKTKENRIWQQFILINNLGRVKFEHRYRVEQRWVNQDYRNRLRYRLMLFLPINTIKIQEGSVFLAFYDEIFLNTQKTFFDRNRAYAALGYQFHKMGNIQVGLLNQRINSLHKWYLQFALTFNTDFSG